MKEYSVPVTRCRECGKLAFESRKKAKRYLLTHFPKGKDMTVYRCQGDLRWYHYGHTPYGVKRGIQQRGYINPQRRKRNEELGLPLRDGREVAEQGE